jgi:uncharacterized protein YndB with AHSA1/START domain
MSDAPANLSLTAPPVAKAELLIRRPVAEVFEAFIDPEITTKFWFTKGSGRLKAGKKVQWDWEMYDVSARVNVLDLVPNEHIRIDWSDSATPAIVEWRFTPLEGLGTFVSITNSGFTGSGDEITAQAIGAAEAFTLVLAGLKAWLEHGIALNLIADRFPMGLEAG